MTLVEEIFTTAGKTALTTGENVVGIAAASRAGDAAAATAASGAWPAWIIDPPTNAPPAINPRLSISDAMTHIGYLVTRFMFYPSRQFSPFLKNYQEL